MLEHINGFIWGVPALLLILGMGIYLSIRTGFIQLRLFHSALGLFFQNLFKQGSKEEGISQFQALCTALAATVGTGNLAGVAGAIALGGPGAVFWIWVSGILGMVVKFMEATLAVRWRVKNGAEGWIGGPMYMISKGMGWRWRPMAVCYCVFGAVAALGVGNATQINAALSGIHEMLAFWGKSSTQTVDIVIGLVLAAVIGLCLSGGAKGIGKVAQHLVPVAAAGYLLLCILVLVLRIEMLPGAFLAVFRGALDPRAVTGGMVGSAFLALRTGISRGVFTNEAGMGTAAIAHGSANVAVPEQQGKMGMIEVFLDTVVICTMTALVILCSGVPIPYGNDTGAALTAQAFEAVLGGWVAVPIAMFLCAFAFATVLGWGLYGGRCVQYLFGGRGWKGFVLIQTVVVVFSAVLDTAGIWLFAEIFNGLMCIPNLIALFFLSDPLLQKKKAQNA